MFIPKTPLLVRLPKKATYVAEAGEKYDG